MTPIPEAAVEAALKARRAAYKHHLRHCAPDATEDEAQFVAMRAALEATAPHPPAPDAAVEAAVLAERPKRGIYIASKAKYAPRWLHLRDVIGDDIISTWIDEAGVGETSDWPDLWGRCIREASSAAVLIVYCEPGDILKGAWIECGAALAAGVPVYGVGIEDFSIAKSGHVQLFPSMDEAIARARSAAPQPRGGE